MCDQACKEVSFLKSFIIADLVFRYNINWNYGLLPQTWEDPSHSNPEVENSFGDNDPGEFLPPTPDVFRCWKFLGMCVFVC
jgi:inorganic pyrophosphatase